MSLFPSLRKNLYLRIPWVRWNIALSLLVNAALWILVYARVEPKVEPVPLHLSVYFGIDYTAPYWYYYFFPIGGLVVAVAHTLVGRLYFRTHPLIAFIALTASAIIQFITFGVVALLVSYAQ